MSSGSTTEIESAIFSGGEGVEGADEKAIGTPIENKNQPVQHEFSEGGLKAWLVVFGCWCTSFASFGYVNSFGVYETYYLQTFLSDHSPSDVAWIGAIQAFAQFSAAMVSGPIADRYGPVIVIWPCSLLLVVAMMLTSLCTEFYQFILCQGIFLGFSSGLIFTPAISVVGHYFHKRRPIAMAFATTGSPLGGLIYPVIMTNLLRNKNVGFPWGQRVCGFLTLFLLAIAAVTIRPTSLRRKGALILPEAFKIPAFSLQVAALFMVILGLWTPYFYLADYGSAHGMSANLASYLFAIINGGSFMGRVFAGAVARKLGQFNVIAVSCYCSAILMFCWLKITSSAGLIVLAILFGATSGIVIALMMSTLAQTADHPSKIGTYLGMSTFLVGFGGLAGTPITGALIEKYDGYSQGIIFSGAALIAGAVLLTCARFAFSKDKLIV
ncbi:major facilitator superfamily domain-containing protein [Trichoderma evansii]